MGEGFILEPIQGTRALCLNFMQFQALSGMVGNYAHVYMYFQVIDIQFL